MTRLLLLIKHRLPLIWRIVEWLNSFLFWHLHGDKVRSESEQCFLEFTLDGYDFRALCYEDLDGLVNLLERQDVTRLEHFKPHGFDHKSLERVYQTPTFLMFGVIKDSDLIAYFFLRCFWNRRSFVGRLIDEPFERQGIGRVMNEILYNTSWRSGFRCHTTISKDNSLVMRSHAKNPHVRILGQLPNDYLFIEFVNPALAGGLKTTQRVIKRVFDLVAGAIALALTSWIIAISWILASVDTWSNGLFTQRRVGQHGRLFTAVKLRTMRPTDDVVTNVTTSNDPRITRLGRIWRRTKIDELPQLWNVLLGNMSFVGPRPDVAGFADELEGDDRIILSVRPGITGPATLRYRNEEELLASVEDPEAYNRDVIYPDKVRLNREYVENWSFWRDIHYILATLFGRN